MPERKRNWQDKGRRRALVTAIYKYENAAGDLAGAQIDAARLARRFEDDGDFEIARLQNPDGEKLRREVAKFLSDGVGDDDTLVLSFSCHGEICRGDLMLQGIDGTLDASLPGSLLLSWVARSAAENVLVILDCCRSGTAITPEWLGRQLASASSRCSRWVIAACLGNENARGDVSGGYFTSTLIESFAEASADSQQRVGVGACIAWAEAQQRGRGGQTFVSCHSGPDFPLVARSIRVQEVRASRITPEATWDALPKLAKGLPGPEGVGPRPAEPPAPALPTPPRHRGQEHHTPGPAANRAKDNRSGVTFAPPSAATVAPPASLAGHEPQAAEGLVAAHAGNRRAIGIDLGSTKIRACIRAMGEPNKSSPREPNYVEDVRRPATARSLIEQIRTLISRIMDAEHLSRKPPIGIGLAVPGQVDVRAGTLKFGPGLGVRNVPFRTALAKAYPDVPVIVDNDARCATRCELHLGVGRDFENFVCIFIGSGVGSGVVVNRQILFGQNYCAGEIGHTKISNTGTPCTCGQVGCLETFVKGPAITALAQAKTIDWESRGLVTILTKASGRIDPLVLSRAIEAGDLAAMEVAEEVGQRLGQGISNYLNIMNPGSVVLGGGLMTGFYLHLVDSITRSIQRNAIAEVANTPIIQSQYSDEGAALGAALLFHPDERWPYGQA